ncbi:MAG: AAA family ATPase, partial [Candidatus Kryptoniota bacterium]
MIQHLRIDFPPVIKSQTLMELGRVNILTGRNSSGKSTVLRRIVEKPDIGITFHRSKEWESSISTLIYKNMPPNVVNLGSFIDNVLRKLDGKIFLSIDGSQVYELLSEAKRFSPGGNMVGDHVITMITNMVTTHELPSNRVILLYPKRQLADYSNADAATGLDSMAKAALSRLFHLQNQPKDSKEKIVYESIFNNFYDITGKEFYIQTDPNKPQAAIQLLFRRVGGSWILSHNEGLGLAEVLTILLYSLDGNYQLIMIEEPENHLHPDLQRRLLSFLNSVEDRQYILSTHSPVFLNPTMADRIYLCRYGNGEIKIDDNTKRAEALTEIGVLAIDNLTSDAIIISEGKTDGEAINYIVKNWFDAPSGVSIIHV